jgi:hypothetical protein
MNGSYLLLHVHILHLGKARSVFCFRIAVIAGCGFLPARSFLLGNRLPRNAIKEITALACEPFQIVCSIIVPKVCR